MEIRTSIIILGVIALFALGNHWDAHFRVQGEAPIPARHNQPQDATMYWDDFGNYGIAFVP